jgi:hypothetical protein
MPQAQASGARNITASAISGVASRQKLQEGVVEC